MHYATYRNILFLPADRCPPSGIIKTGERGPFSRNEKLSSPINPVSKQGWIPEVIYHAEEQYSRVPYPHSPGTRARTSPGGNNDNHRLFLLFFLAFPLRDIGITSR